jgi:hypothetical protein
VLHRSAAALALECLKYREAETLIFHALLGMPPEEVAEELRNLLDNVGFRRQISLHGLHLLPDQFQFSFGPATVGTAELLGRIEYLEKLVYRTAERVVRRPFRERGRRTKTLERDFELLISPPRSPGFAMSVTIGSSKQLRLPHMNSVDFGPLVVDELFTCLELFNRSNHLALKERINDLAYYRNFVALARMIAPDGQDVRAIGLTAVRKEGEWQVLITTPQSRALTVEDVEEAPSGSRKRSIHGILRYKDFGSEGRGEIEIEDEFGRCHTVQVPPGQMSDIVRPMMEDEVVIHGFQHGEVIVLDSIETAELSLARRKGPLDQRSTLPFSQESEAG